MIKRLTRRTKTAFRLLISGDIKNLFYRTFYFFRNFCLGHQKISYKKWRKRWVEIDGNTRLRIDGQVKNMPVKPSFTLLIEVKKSNAYLIEKTLDSLILQNYPEWDVLIRSIDPLDEGLVHTIKALGDTRVSLCESFSKISGDWVGEISSGDLLHETSLFVIAKSITSGHGIKVVYTDNDHINPKERFVDPHMKPDWNSELLAGMNYLDILTVFEKEVWENNYYECGDLHEMTLNATAGLDENQILHIPHVLASKRVGKGGEHLNPRTIKTAYNFPETPTRVSIIIPTRDEGEMLKRCLDSLHTVTDYPDYEIIIIDHESTEPLAREIINGLKEKTNFHVETYSGSFNFSAMVNKGARKASGEIFVLLNNDTEIIHESWLKKLVSQTERENIGIVGALLLFPDGTIQHAGVHPGITGLMGHGHKHWPGDSAGYFSRLKIPHYVAAVTGACMAIKKSTWELLGGFDEINLAVAYNDIDICLKARALGLKIILDPNIRLLHHESATRGFDTDSSAESRLMKELNLMKERWGTLLFSDPAYSPNLSFIDDGGFSLASTPRSENLL